MRRYVSVIALACSLSCSSEPAESGSETTASTQAAIVGSCTEDTFGLPCDPDGPLGPKLECEGQCWFGGTLGNGGPYCHPLAGASVTAQNGMACGSPGGVGDTACANRCQNGACVSVPATAGAACRPSNTSGACSGACDGAGQCDTLVNPCKFGRDNCKFDSCNALNATQCKVEILPATTPCEDGNGCTISDKCASNGTCSAGTAKKCDDFNPCTDDTCNPANGACIGTNNTKPCDDKNACTTGDVCGGGSCKAGSPLTCADTNPCTADSCVPATGCKFTPDTCDDNDACTADSCDPSSGACGHSPVNCDDNDPCTTDTCAAATGCAHALIPGCGDSGIGGSGGSGGTAGSSGGSAGAGTGGIAGSGTGGTAGNSGGAAGAGTGGTAGTSTGGSAGSTGGSGGSGGSSGGSGGSGDTGGSSTGGSGGGTTDAGTGGKKAFETTEDDGGCGCRVPRQSPASSGILVLGLALLGLSRRRRH